MKEYILQSAKTLILALVIGVGVSYVSAQREGWQVPPGSPPDCPTGYSGCDAPIHVGANDQVKAGGLSVDRLNTANGAIIGGSLGISLGRDGSGYPIAPSYPLHVKGKVVAEQFCFFSDPTNCLGNTSSNPVVVNSANFDASTTIGPNRCDNAIRIDMTMDATRQDGDESHHKIFTIKVNGTPVTSVQFGAYKGGDSGHNWAYTAKGLSSHWLITDTSQQYVISGEVTGSSNVTLHRAQYSVTCM